MTTVVERDAVLVESFREALGEPSVLASAELIERHLERHPLEYAIVLGPTVTIEAATAFAERSRIQRPMLSVILVREQFDSDVLSNALRSGMREVVEVDDLEGLTDAVERAHSLARAISETVEQANAAPRRLR